MLQAWQACKAQQARDPVQTVNGHIFKGVSFCFVPQNEAAAFSWKFFTQRISSFSSMRTAGERALLKNPAISEVPDAC